METIIVESRRSGATADAGMDTLDGTRRWDGDGHAPVSTTILTGTIPAGTTPAGDGCLCPGLDLIRLHARYVSRDGVRIIRVFQAPDAELVRRALKFLSIQGYRTTGVWAVR